MRRGKVKYFCKACGGWFQINRKEKINIHKDLSTHLLGISYRGLEFQDSRGASSHYSDIRTLLKQLPHVADITRKYCTSYGGILLVDGKYIKVKGYDRKIPILYGIDYTTHDIPTYIFSVAENYQTCLSFFQSLRLLNYPLQALVCDDNRNIYEACRQVYPKVIVQLCQTHYLRSIRVNLNVVVDPTYRPFIHEVGELLKTKRSKEDFQTRSQKIYDYYYHDPRCTSVMTDIALRMDLLCGYMHLKGVPRTNNLIESFNSHLQGRLKTIKGFQSFHSAKEWLNAYFLFRRVKKFTDCTGKFKRLNGRAPLQNSMKDTAAFERILNLFK